MTNSSIREYLNAIAMYPLLTQTQEIELSRQVQAMLAITTETPTKAEQRIIKRGNKARDKLINCNLRLVVHVAKNYLKRLNGNSMELVDLVQEGSFGLHRAAEKFDPSRGYKFSTYAYWWIRQSIGRAIDTQEKIIRLPLQKLDLIYAAIKYRNECAKTKGRATIAEMADHVGITADEMSMLLNRYAIARSLDERCGEEGDVTLLELIADDYCVEENVEQMFRSEHVQLAFFRLNERDRSVLSRYYGIGSIAYSQREIATQDQVCRERINRRIETARNRLRAVLQTQNLTVH